ncbi:CRAL-TRIO domain and GOLD domain-containing protein [Aphelenchoides bicaudatus]|nr:CRAL-TRIO domain and GOLD domain-containing protein [Aphelenchoides bicaudatus]
MLSPPINCTFQENNKTPKDKISISSNEDLNELPKKQRNSMSSSSGAGDATSLKSWHSLSSEESSHITELRERLGAKLLEATPLYNDDHSLLRWIHGWDAKFSEIVPRYQKASQIFEALGLNELDFETPDDVNDFVGNMYPASEYFVGGLMGYDNHGNAIVVQSVGQIAPKHLVHCGRVSDVFYLSIVEAVLTMKLIKRQEKKYNRRLGIIVMLDLDGLCVDHIMPQTVKVYMNLLKLLQDLFPDVAQKICIINAPSLFASAYNLVKPAIAMKSRQKIRVLSHTYKEQLCEELGAENIYPHWGGTKVAVRGREDTGTLRMGGIPPESLRYIPLNNPHHIDDLKLTKINVPARSTRCIEVECAQDGHTLNWFFHSSSDVEFSVFYKNEKEEEHLVVPQFRVHTSYVPEYNSVKCRKAGTYILCFDNTFSTFFSKDVRYHAHCVDPNCSEEEETGIDCVEALGA